MKLIVIVNEDVHTAAIKYARELGKGQPLSPAGLNAPLDNEITTKINEIWDKIEGALKKAYQDGIDAAQPLITKVSELTTELNAKKFAKEVHAVIAERLNAYFSSMVDGSLQRVKPTIKIGGEDLKITAVTVEQQIQLSSSLKVSLTQICDFIAKGEISLSAEYRVKE